MNLISLHAEMISPLVYPYSRYSLHVLIQLQLVILLLGTACLIVGFLYAIVGQTEESTMPVPNSALCCENTNVLQNSRQGMMGMSMNATRLRRRGSQEYYK